MSVRCYDVAILGLGVMGSAVACQLSREGRRVVGLEQFTPGHNRGSSHGQSRIIRKGYFEHADYVPLVVQAYQRWHHIEASWGRPLLLNTGGLIVGAPESPMITGALASAQAHRALQQIFGYDELKRRYPQMLFQPHEIAIYEEDMAVLRAEACVRALQSLASDNGADLRFGVTADIDLNAALSTRGEITIETEGGPVRAHQVVIAVGPWTSKILGDRVNIELTVERIPTFWFNPLTDQELFAPERLPVCLWDYQGEPFGIFPNIDSNGVKVAFHHSHDFTTPDSIDRTVHAREIATMRAQLARAVPALNGPLQSAAVCMYTNTPDEHFAIGMIEESKLLLLAPCSGHGFKFAPVIAEIASDLLGKGSTDHNIELFRLTRSALRQMAKASRKAAKPLAAYARDYGNLLSIMPDMVMQPQTVAEVQEIITNARRQGRRVVARGAGNTGYGQTLTDEIVLDTNGLTEFELLEDGIVCVGAGTRWCELEERLIPLGLSNPVLTSSTEHTVGGTLAVGGFGRTSCHYGMQADQVVALDIVTGTGELVHANARHHSRLFNYSLCGLGQTGIVVRAYLKTRPLQPYSILFARTHAPGVEFDRLYDLISMSEPWQTCMMGYSIANRQWQTIVGFDTATRPESCARDGLVVEHYHRERYRSLATVVRSFRDAQVRAGLVSNDSDTRVLMGDCLLPVRHAGEFFAQLRAIFVDADVVLDIHGYFLKSVGQGEPLPLSPIPRGELSFLFSFPCFVPAERVAEYRCKFDQTIAQCLALGGRLYLYGYYPRTAAFMAAQFGTETVNNWRAVKDQYDPGGIIGAQIF